MTSTRISETTAASDVQTPCALVCLAWELQVYNKLQNGDEYIGTAEVSISTIISNAGQVIQEWVKLVREKEDVGQVRN